MEIVLKRIAKKNTYTIGRLYILADEDVDRKVITSYNEGLKRVFRDSFDEQKLGADTYFCDTMEPTWRNLLGVELAPQQVDARLGRISGKKAQKMKGHTAIPEGTYRVLITQSPRFRQWLPYLQGVPTQGCILVGENKLKGMVVNSRIWLHRLMKLMEEAQQKEESIWITII